MQSEVKNGTKKGPQKKTQKKPRKRWLVYFLFSIGIVGFILCYLVAAPLCAMGYFFPPFWRLGGKVLCFGVYLLLRLQPWYKADVILQIPKLMSGRATFMTVANHRSHLDMFILLSHIPNIRAITKRSLYYVPFLAMMLRVFRMIPVQRGKMESYLAAMEKAEKSVKNGDPVHVFPEMTRCAEGAVGTAEFQLLPFRMAQKSNIPIIPIVFVGTDRAWPKGVLGIRSDAKVLVKTLPAVDPAAFPDANALRDEVKRLIDEELSRHGS